MQIHPVDPTADQPPFDQLRSQVARAYRELEADGVVVTEGRRGTFVASTDAAASGGASEAAAAYVSAVRRLGLPRAEATRLVEKAWPV